MVAQRPGVSTVPNMTGVLTAVPVLVAPEWGLEHLGDPTVRFVEVDERPERGRYAQGHLPGAIPWVWETQLQDPLRRDVASRDQLQELLGVSGIDEHTHIVLYGDPSNWFAAWAYWVLKLHRVARVSLLDGGRSYWVEHEFPLTTDVPAYPRAHYPLPPASFEYRAFREDVLRDLDRGNLTILDVRSPEEYRGDVIAPAGMSETARRAGHIPGAISFPWDETVNSDGRFKSLDDLRAAFGAVAEDAVRQ
jgi:thiosulfate/3-mercaptopyruvate sulfurtransferase